ncbi:MAG: hypothetical protein ACE5JG_01445, partial [Planctomycetota bacterium]
LARPQPEAARGRAEVLIARKSGAPAAQLLAARFQAGEEPRTLLPLVETILEIDAGCAPARLLRGRMLAKLGRDADAVRDLRAIPGDAPEVDDAFSLLGQLRRGKASGGALLGRADIMLARKRYENAILELTSGQVPTKERLRRFETVCSEQPKLEKGHRGLAETLLAAGRRDAATEAHFRRFDCPGADPAAVAADLERVARGALEDEEVEVAVGILGRLHDHVPDGADRALAVIGDSRSAPLLILKSKLLQQLGRPEEAVRSLEELARADKASRPQAAAALSEVVAAGRARPEADRALARVRQLAADAPAALAALSRLYEDHVTTREAVRDAAEDMVLEADDAGLRLFLASVCLDTEDPRAACLHAVQARRLRPGVRGDVLALLGRCLERESSADIHFALAEAHLAADEADRAVRHFGSAVEADRGRAEAAIRAMEDAAPRSANAPLLWWSVGTTCAQHLQDPRRAVGAFSRGIEADPPAELRVPLLLGRGEAYTALNQDDEAFVDIDEAARHGTLERRYYEFLRSGHRRRELDAAQRAGEKAGSDFGAAADACRRLIRVGRAEEAVEVAQRCLAAAPEHVVPRYLVGVALHAANRLDAAARALEMVRHQIGPDTEIGRAARMILAECHLDRGDREQARDCLTEIESVDAAYPGLAARRGALAPPRQRPPRPPPPLPPDPLPQGRRLTSVVAQQPGPPYPLSSYDFATSEVRQSCRASHSVRPVAESVVCWQVTDCPQ